MIVLERHESWRFKYKTQNLLVLDPLNKTNVAFNCKICAFRHNSTREGTLKLK